jgi:hypothetical protein
MNEEEKLIREFIGDSVYYDEYGGGYIWGVPSNKKDGVQMIAQVDEPEDDYVLSIRGWGAIQNKFKNISDAKKFQDSLGKWIADAINEKLKQEKL